MKFGYIRISSKDQNVARQLEELSKQGICMENILIDQESGRNFQRNQYQLLKMKLRAGDQVYFHELDRLGRNKQEIKKELLYFKDQGVLLRFLDIPTSLIDYRDFGQMQQSIMEMVNNILIEVVSTQAETELLKIRKRQAEGIAIAKTQGKYKGRKAKNLPENFEKLYALFQAKELSATEFCSILGYKSRTSLYKKLKQYEKQTQEQERI